MSELPAKVSRQMLRVCGFLQFYSSRKRRSRNTL